MTYLPRALHTKLLRFGSSLHDMLLRGTLACGTLACVTLLAGTPSWGDAQTAAKELPRAAAAPPWSLLGRWRVQRGTVAPWVKDRNYHPDTREWLGRTIRFDVTRASGVTLLTCGNARYESTQMPADGLFMSGLLAPEKPAAMALGFKSFPVRGTSFSCDKGVFEFHYADSSAVLVAVNNVIWTLDRSPGALADAGSPLGIVQQFLERHFAGAMGFDAKSLVAKQEFLSSALQARIAAYLRRPSKSSAVPAIDGDPFTDSQEYPTRYSVALAATEGARAIVPVLYNDAYSTKRVQFVLERQGAVWRISDVRYGPNEPTFWTLLK